MYNLDNLIIYSSEVGFSIWRFLRSHGEVFSLQWAPGTQKKLFFKAESGSLKKLGKLTRTLSYFPTLFLCQNLLQYSFVLCLKKHQQNSELFNKWVGAASSIGSCGFQDEKRPSFCCDSKHQMCAVGDSGHLSLLAHSGLRKQNGRPSFFNPAPY